MWGMQYSPTIKGGKHEQTKTTAISIQCSGI